MNIRVETITPERATQILATQNTGNRTISRRHVAVLAEEIKAGRWKLNGDTICFNGSRLIDGQHRLSAIAASGIPVESLVVYGLSDDVFETKDIGKRRSSADTLSHMGLKNATRTSAALVMLDRYYTGRINDRLTYTNSMIVELLERYPDVHKSIHLGDNIKGLIPPSVLDACHYIFSALNADEADRFSAAIMYGAGISEGHPYHVLRERLIKNSMSTAKLPKPDIMALCIKAWNATRSGAKVRRLVVPTAGGTEPFPVAV